MPSLSTNPTGKDLALYLRTAELLPQGTGTVSGSSTLTGVGSSFLTELGSGDYVVANGQARKVSAIGSATSLTPDTAFSPAPVAGSPFYYTSLDLDTAASAGRLAYERRTGRTLLAVASADYVFDAPVNSEGYFAFPFGFSGITAFGYQPHGATLQAWAEGTDYRLLPANAAALGLPYTGAILLRRFSDPTIPAFLQSLVVTGTRGDAATIPEDVWLLVRDFGVLECLIQAQEGRSKGVSRLQMGQDAIQWAVRADSLYQALSDAVDGKLIKGNYRRITL